MLDDNMTTHVRLGLSLTMRTNKLGRVDHNKLVEVISSGSDGLIINTTITLSSKRFVYRLVLDLQTIAVVIL